VYSLKIRIPKGVEVKEQPAKGATWDLEEQAKVVAVGFIKANGGLAAIKAAGIKVSVYKWRTPVWVAGAQSEGKAAPKPQPPPEPIDTQATSRSLQAELEFYAGQVREAREAGNEEAALLALACAQATAQAISNFPVA
jgi:hypothetical protein